MIREPNKFKAAHLFLAVSAVLLILLSLELGARLVVRLTYGSKARKEIWELSYQPYLLHLSKRSGRERWQDFVNQNQPPSEGQYRILVLGASTAEACPENTIKETFQPYVGQDVKVLNLAQVGYIISQELIMLSLYGVNFHPDLVITLDGANDIVNMTKTERPEIHYQSNYIKYAVEHPVLNGLRSLFNRSQFVHSLIKIRERRSERLSQHDEERFVKMTQNYLQTIDTMAVLVTGYGAQYIHVLQPCLFSRKNTTERERALAKMYEYRKQFMVNAFQKLDENLSRHRFPKSVYYVYATDAFNSTDKECFKDEVHLTENGYRILWDYIAEEARKQGFRPVKAEGETE